MAERGRGLPASTEILEAAGASKGQLYHYFSDKGDLVRAVIARRLGETVDGQGPLLTELDSLAAIRRWFDMLIDENENQAAPAAARHARQRARRPQRGRSGRIGRLLRHLDGLPGQRPRTDAGPRRPRRRRRPPPARERRVRQPPGWPAAVEDHEDPQYLRDALDASYAHLCSFRPIDEGRGPPDR